MTNHGEFSSPSPQAGEWLERLQANGYRITAPRRAVVEVIATSQHVLSPFNVFQQAKERYSNLGLVTVYRTIEKLEELGLVERVHRPSGCHTFCAAADGHQHLLICEACGRVERFSGDRLERLMDSVGSESGFRVQSHWLQLFGRCQACLAETIS